ncbi:DUF3299 domain-containing protein [Ruegeria sp. SCP11]|uniref:DUF3299 domain-containing protein n=1 Tax=Ruegeria sp. SCP11 TaxID=3141378 RepID=UPI00333750BD
MIQTRRYFLYQAAAVAGFLSVLSTTIHAETTPIELGWDDLVPDSGGATMERLRKQGIVQHGELSTPFDQETAAELTTEYNSKLVRIPGYLVPLEVEERVMKSALLVPYVGACIHVPPPPPNQLIFITTATPYEYRSMFEPVWVVGTFGTAATSTQLAEVGYTLVAEKIDPYS